METLMEALMETLWTKHKTAWWMDQSILPTPPRCLLFGIINSLLKYIYLVCYETVQSILFPVAGVVAITVATESINQSINQSDGHP